MKNLRQLNEEGDEIMGLDDFVQDLAQCLDDDSLDWQKFWTGRHEKTRVVPRDPGDFETAMHRVWSLLKG